MITGFGKIPDKADFVRIGHADATTRKFETLLDEAWSRLAESSPDAVLAPVRFAFRPAGAPYAFVGVIRPSTDSIGRRFPLTMGFLLPWHLIASRWSAVPAALGPFLDAADSLIQSAAGLTIDELQQRALMVRGPTDSDVLALDSVCRRVLDETAWSSMAQRLFETATNERSAYALHAALMACAQGSSQLAIDCPIREDVDLFFWLELARRFSDNEQISFAWVEEESPRLIVSLGSKAQLPLTALSDPKHESDHIWPLETEREVSRQMALDKLGSALTPVESGGPPLETLLQNLSRTGAR